jgi:Ulp1 family protease
VDLFSFRFVFVPIHDHLHWSLAVICNIGSTARQGEPNAPFILHLDSLRGAQDVTCHGLACVVDDGKVKLSSIQAPPTSISPAGKTDCLRQY